ncbi:uncharacterized protein EAE97_000662 [Botrytis byssoidea]|uniref:Uncharacterized protein n=1 Tax=Botrytis byssoidea TaxID=139641 RepID=A0A9P5J0H8_9HELO|nr:uncharacterized protein EAE97_000662 [Botrytis byssoidea]KAF7955403.1 hypothetical protein EAE97_000662 [Botrytis byssoidea]
MPTRLDMGSGFSRMRISAAFSFDIGEALIWESVGSPYRALLHTQEPKVEIATSARALSAVVAASPRVQVAARADTQTLFADSVAASVTTVAARLPTSSLKECPASQTQTTAIVPTTLPHLFNATEAIFKMLIMINAGPNVWLKLYEEEEEEEEEEGEEIMLKIFTRDSKQ